MRWYRKAADQGHAHAQGNLGIMYSNGRGVAQSDDVEAVRWYRKAADQGHAMAQFNLGAIYFNGEGVQEDLAAAHNYFTLAAAQGFEQAKEILIKHFPEGAPTSTEPLTSSVSSCARCGAAAADLKACARCKSVAYCSRECQAAHWKAGHKKNCFKKN